MRLKAIADHNRVVRLEDWNLTANDLNGTNDMKSIVTAADTQAASAGFPLMLGDCELLLGTTATATVPWIGGNWAYGPTASTLPRTKFIPGMTDGSACIKVGNVGGWHLEKLAVMYGGTVDPAGARSCIGIDIGTYGSSPVASYAGTRGVMRDVYIYGCTTGLRMQGWLNAVYNVHVNSCQTGLIGEQLNTNTFDIVFENCNKGFAIRDTLAVFFQRIEDEGAYGNAASTIDAIRDIVIGAYSAEQVTRGAYPWLAVGSSGPNRVFNLRILSGLATPPAVGTAPIALDYVDGHEININCTGGASNNTRRSISTTANTRNLGTAPPRPQYGFPFTTINMAHQQPAQNLLPNPYMIGKRFGARDWYLNRVTATEETTTFRTGNKALRLTATTTAGGDNYAWWDYSGDIATMAQNNTVTVAGWVYIPSGVSMNAEPTATYNVVLRISDIDGSNAQTGTSQSASYAVEGGWNFLHATLAFSGTTDRIRIRAFVNTTTTTATTSQYIIVDSLFVCIGDCWEDIYAGRVTQSPLASGAVDGGKLRLRVTQSYWATIVADPTQEWEVGDTIEYTDPAAAGDKGIVCTTGGAGGTAVFKAFGVIAA